MTVTRISALIHTLNEERRLDYALRSVAWCDEIVVVDMHSDDRTVEIAQERGARVVQHERLGFADPARPFGVAQCTGDWILTIDADELVTPALAAALVEAASSDVADVYYIHAATWLLGRVMQGTGWDIATEQHARFFRRDAMDFTPVIHDFMRPKASARVAEIPADAALVHYNYVDLADFVDRLNRYTTIEARQRVERGERADLHRAVYRGARETWKRFVSQRGYRDGWRGFCLSVLMGVYRFLTTAKMIELRKTGGRDAIERLYDEERERWLA
ncbi:MAG: glycosyltransferase family 2 protein [Chloroflexota bacterium]